MSNNNNNSNRGRTTETGYRNTKPSRENNTRVTYVDVHRQHGEYNSRNDNFENEHKERRSQQSSNRGTMYILAFVQMRIFEREDFNPDNLSDNSN